VKVPFFFAAAKASKVYADANIYTVLQIRIWSANFERDGFSSKKYEFVHAVLLMCQKRFSENDVFSQEHLLFGFRP